MPRDHRGSAVSAMRACVSKVCTCLCYPVVASLPRLLLCSDNTDEQKDGGDHRHCPCPGPTPACIVLHQDPISLQWRFGVLHWRTVAS